MLARRRMPQRQSTRTVRIPAPVGGLNTVAPASELPPLDAPVLVNLLGSEYGLRARLGSREWCTGLDGPVRSMLAYSGSVAGGSTNKRFACTATGIYDVTASSATPTQVVTFPVTSSDAGWGVATAFHNSSGHYLLYADEENGLYVYTETGNAWVKVVPKATANWAATTAYTAGQYVLNDSGKTYVCDQSGTSAGAGGPTGTAANIVDNTARWDYVLHVLDGVDPDAICHVVVHKTRVFYTQRSTGSAWYPSLDALYGTVTRFRFGAQFKAGGDLVGLWRWTKDAGAGMDDALVAISSGGDVLIYEGTDPSSASSWLLKGTWQVGGVPKGRDIATDIGGDLAIIASVGLVPLSKLIAGNVDSSQYTTAKVANLFAQFVALYGGNRGWALRLHPQENALVVLVPGVEGQSATPLVMSLASRGWTLFRDINMTAACASDRQFYVGTSDNRVLVNDGYVDGVTLADPGSFTPIQWSLVTRFGGSDRQTRVHFIKPVFLSQGGAVTWRAKARFDFDFTEVNPVAATGATGSDVWGTGTWDDAVWQGEYAPSKGLSGGSGMGRDVAVAIRGTSTARTVLVKVAMDIEEGGLL